MSSSDKLNYFPESNSSKKDCRTACWISASWRSIKCLDLHTFNLFLTFTTSFSSNYFISPLDGTVLSRRLIPSFTCLIMSTSNGMPAFRSSLAHSSKNRTLMCPLTRFLSIDWLAQNFLDPYQSFFDLDLSLSIIFFPSKTLYRVDRW